MDSKKKLRSVTTRLHINGTGMPERQRNELHITARGAEIAEIYIYIYIFFFLRHSYVQRPLDLKRIEHYTCGLW